VEGARFEPSVPVAKKPVSVTEGELPGWDGEGFEPELLRFPCLGEESFSPLNSAAAGEAAGHSHGAGSCFAGPTLRAERRPLTPSLARLRGRQRPALRETRIAGLMYPPQVCYGAPGMELNLTVLAGSGTR
jgi:hypothetical protein